MSTIRCHDSMDVVSRDPPTAMPALLTRMSSESMSSAADAQSASEVTSRRRYVHRPGSPCTAGGGSA